LAFYYREELNQNKEFFCVHWEPEDLNSEASTKFCGKAPRAFRKLIPTQLTSHPTSSPAPLLRGSHDTDERGTTSQKNFSNAGEGRRGRLEGTRAVWKHYS